MPGLDDGDDLESMRFTIDGERLRDLPALLLRAVDLADQVARVPARLPLDLRVLVLDLVAVGRQPRRPAVRSRDEDHRIALRDRQLVGRLQDVVQRLAHARDRIRIHRRLLTTVGAPVAAAEATAISAAAASAAPHAVPSSSAVLAA